MDINELLLENATFLQDSLINLFNQERNISDPTLIDAMQYSTLLPGKRIRPFLVIETAKLFNIPRNQSLPVALAIELIHTYSLIHDDLPMMDNDDLRRGWPTCHKKFDEATALLAGDGLLTLAFKILSAASNPIDPVIKNELIYKLAYAAGSNGMISGQMMDINLDIDLANIDTIIEMKAKKTASLFEIACEAGAIIAGQNISIKNYLKSYGRNLGILFQIVDDLIDLAGNPDIAGKKLNKDLANNKPNLINKIGMIKTKEFLEIIKNKALESLNILNLNNHNILIDLIYLIINRNK